MWGRRLDSSGSGGTVGPSGWFLWDGRLRISLSVCQGPCCMEFGCSVEFSGLRAFPPRVNWWRRETDYTPPSTAEVKNKWSHTSTPPRPICLHSTNRGDFTLTFYRMIFEVLMAVSIQITVFLGIMPCSLVGAYQIFLSTQWRHVQSNPFWRSEQEVLWSFGFYVPNYTASHSVKSCISESRFIRTFYVSEQTIQVSEKRFFWSTENNDRLYTIVPHFQESCRQKELNPIKQIMKPNLKVPLKGCSFCIQLSCSSLCVLELPALQ